MAKLEIKDQGILYINPDPSRYHVFASHPHPHQLSENEFVCSYSRGAAMGSVDLNLAFLRSADGGVTWREEGLLWNRQLDDRAYSYHDGMLSQLRDGTLAVFGFRADRSDPDQAMVGPTGGLIASQPVLFFSRDQGRSWSSPQVMPLPQGMTATPANPLIELADGAWMACLDQWRAFSDPDPNPYRPRMWAFFSSDRGRTWSEPVLMADGAAQGKGFWHGKTLRLLDGRLYTLYRAAPVVLQGRGGADLTLHYAFSDATGRHWSWPEPTTIPGQTHYPAQLPDGRLAAIYTWRETERPGFMVVLSTDDGRTWDLEHQVRVWDATGWTHLGVNTANRWPHSHAAIAFGAPSLLATAQGELYASWWCTYASLTHLRWARVRVDRRRGN